MSNHLRALVLVVLALAGLPGCDGRIELVTDDTEGPETVERVSALEQRIERLEGHVTGLKETSYVQSEPGQFVMKLNTQTAVVIVTAIAGLVTLLVVWMRLVFARDRQDRPAENAGGANPESQTS